MYSLGARWLRLRARRRSHPGRFQPELLRLRRRLGQGRQGSQATSLQQRLAPNMRLGIEAPHARWSWLATASRSTTCRTFPIASLLSGRRCQCSTPSVWPNRRRSDVAKYVDVVITTRMWALPSQLALARRSKTSSLNRQVMMLN